MATEETRDLYNVSPIRSPITTEHISRYSVIRLDALKLDSFAFTAKYADESQFTDDQWRNLLEARDRITMIAYKGTSLLSEDAQWACVGNLLTPSYLKTQEWNVPYDFLGLQQEEVYAYMLEGFWTRPEHRGHGLAEQMGRAIVELIRAEGPKGKRLVLTLQVHPDNQAQALYKRFGFIKKGIWKDDPVQEDWMVLEVANVDLSHGYS